MLQQKPVCAKFIIVIIFIPEAHMLGEMRAFSIFAEVGSVQAAAARLYLTQSAVTRQIKRLEQELGTPLLDRRFKPPILTPAGSTVLERSRDILQQVAELKAISSPTKEPAGKLRVGVGYVLSDDEFIGCLHEVTTSPSFRDSRSCFFPRTSRERSRDQSPWYSLSVPSLIEAGGQPSGSWRSFRGSSSRGARARVKCWRRFSQAKGCRSKSPPRCVTRTCSFLWLPEASALRW
ncbi:MAG: LysR family transcriptional regulator [Alphaproteobacteria bacterium]|nr:MAG: LysR family transcriptional regulator [Alphaproteobacteria bacterium]